MKRLSLVPAILIIATASWVGVARANGTASLSLVPASGSSSASGTLTLNIHENSGSEAINAVETDLKYDPARLQFENIDTSTSAFDSSAVAKGGDGTVSLSRAKLQTSLTGDQVVGTVVFKTLATSGTTTISFASSSGIISYQGTKNIWNGDTSGGTYTLTAASAEAAPATSSETYLVAIKVIDHNGTAVNKASVTIDNSPAQLTDPTGVASFVQVNPGQHQISVSAYGQTTHTSLNVRPENPQTAQQLVVQLSVTRPAKTSDLGVGLIVVLIIIIIGAIAAYYWLPRAGKDHKS